MRKIVALVLALCMMLGLSSVSALAESANVLKYGTDAEPVGFDPHTISAVASIRMINQMYNQLVDVDEDLNVIPELAESWDQPDETTYVFHLRKGVKFHNGREMTATDVVYSFERILSPDLGALGNSGNYFNMISSMEAVDDYTVKFVLSSINAPFLANLSSTYASIVCKEVVEENKGDILRADAGTGPYTLGEWVPDNRVVLNGVKDFYLEGQPTFDSIEYYVMTDMSARLAALRTGQVQLIVGNASSVPLVSGDSNIQILSYQSRNYQTLCLNLSLDVFKDVRVRQAISLAVNRDEILDLVYDGQAVISGFAPASMGHWAVEVKDHPLYQQDIEKAKALMAEAGYANGFEVTLTTGLLDTLRDLATVLQQQLAEIGITVKVENVENAQYIDQWNNKSFQMMVCQNGAGSDPSRAVAFFFSTGGAANIAGYSNARVDELCALGAGTTDTEARRGYYQEAMNIILEECPNVTFASPMDYFFARKELTGFTPNASNANDFSKATLTK